MWKCKKLWNMQSIFKLRYINYVHPQNFIKFIQNNYNLLKMKAKELWLIIIWLLMIKSWQNIINSLVKCHYMVGILCKHCPLITRFTVLGKAKLVQMFSKSQLLGPTLATPYLICAPLPNNCTVKSQNVIILPLKILALKFPK
jgi:hypothetical protein